MPIKLTTSLLWVWDWWERGWMESLRGAEASPDCPHNTALPLFLSTLTKGFGKTSPCRECSANGEDKESSGLWRQGKYYRDFVGAFFFPWKDIIPDVIICGLAPTSILPSDYCRVSLDSDQFNWNQNAAEGVWKLLSIFNTPETWLGMLRIDQGN